MPPRRKLAAILCADVAGYSRLMAGDEAGTLQALNAARAAVGKKLLDLTANDPYFQGALGWSYGRLGQTQRAKAIVTRLQAASKTREVPPPAIYYVYLGLQDQERALDWMYKAYEGRWADMAWIGVGPEYQ